MGTVETIAWSFAGGLTGVFVVYVLNRIRELQRDIDDLKREAKR